MDTNAMRATDYAKVEFVALLRSGYRGQVGRVRGLTKDKQRIIVNVEHGFVISVVPSELELRKGNPNE